MQKQIGNALVVGAGIAGIRSALDLAETGVGVTLIDRAPHVGGMLSRLDVQFPNNHCGMCRMLPLLERDRGAQFCLRKGLFHENITIRTSTRLMALDGAPGHMAARLRSAPSWVDPTLCVGCGQCVHACPIDVPDAFNAGLSMRKAIYLPVPHAIPNPYVIDPVACTRCGACVDCCPTGAITLPADARSGFRILVVDDELVVRDSLKEWLKDEGFDVTMAESGSQALEMIADVDFHLMLSDIKMPGMDGVELLASAKEQAPDLIVVMMTAYATVETAVAAMKIGAMDYLMKPFDPEAMMAMVNRIYREAMASRDETLAVGAVVLACGAQYVDPSVGINPYGYGTLANVFTHLEFERLLSGTGPLYGRLVRPADGKPVQKIAFLQCVGSRDLQADADFCSNVCCMIAIKQARLVKTAFGDRVDTAIFYMDMRTPGLSHQRFRDEAQTHHGIRFERARVHSTVPDPKTGCILLRYVRMDNRVKEEFFDVVVLAVGQRPADGNSVLTEHSGLELNPWGFIRHQPFYEARTDHPGIMAAGSCTGLKDISESVIQASAAALHAKAAIHRKNNPMRIEEPEDTVMNGMASDPPRVLVALCTCKEGQNRLTAFDAVKERLGHDPCVADTMVFDRLCTTEEWTTLESAVQSTHPNRILIGACRPYALASGLRHLAKRCGLSPRLVEAVDLRIHEDAVALQSVVNHSWIPVATALARLKHVDPVIANPVSVMQRALVVGGGIAGMHAALAIADQGIPVDLVEKSNDLGGNLSWINSTIGGLDVRKLLATTCDRVVNHAKIDVSCDTRITNVTGQIGAFLATLESAGDTPHNEIYGAIVLATGGNEAPTASFGHGAHPAIVTQQALEMEMTSGAFDPQSTPSVAFILCVDSRMEPRNYCSRVCCPTALKQALKIKTDNPQATIAIFYRDMMTCGFTEAYFSEARRAGVLFIAYTLERPPEVKLNGQGLVVLATDKVVHAPLEFSADKVVLATGVNPILPEEITESLGMETTQDGFFKAADDKWRPVDALKQGVFGCGLVLGPRNISKSIATAQAAAQHALRILCRPSIRQDTIAAQIRHSLCSVCESCIDTCPYHARTLAPEKDKVIINPLMCQGCGACAAVCPNGAAVVAGYGERQILETIDAALVQ